MSELAQGLGAIMRLMKTELTISGLTFSFWDIFLWTMIAGAVALLIGWWFGD